MDNKFKLRLYKKAGKEKGNMDKELFYDSAEELWTTYNTLFCISDYSLNPTIWVRSEEKDWTRYSEADFAKLFLGGKRQIDIIRENIKYTGELCVDLEKETIEAVWELWFDVDRYFGTDTDSDDETWINFYTYWHPDGRVTAMYEIDSEETSEAFDWTFTDKEEKFFLSKMEEYALKKEHCSLEHLLQFEKESVTHGDEARATLISYKGKCYPSGLLTKELIRRYMDSNNFIHGIVKVEFSDMIDNDLEAFLDCLSEKLTGSPLLMEISYEPVSVCDDGEIYLLVSGDVTEVLEKIE